MSRPIAQAAASISYFEKARVHRSRAEIELAEALLQQHSLSYQAIGVTTTVRNYTIANAVLDSTTGLLFQDRVEIPETAYFVPGATTSLQARCPGLVRLDDSEDIIIGYNNVHSDYQHWLTQCMPAIDWSLRQRRTRRVRLVLPALAGWQEDSLAILGYSRVPRLTLRPNTLYHLPHAEYSQFLNGTTSFGICLTACDTARRMLDRLPPAASPYPVLFVPCANPYYGGLRNENEVIELLRRYGVYVVDQNLSAAERINLFRHADVVIGPHGRGLADVLFCKPRALLWEWMPRHHLNVSYNRLAQAAEVDYWGDLFEGDPAPDAPKQWVVDLDTVARQLARISQRLVRRPARTDGMPAPASNPPADGKPIDELMLAFENLGDNCEFGLVQRRAGVEPLGLLRFAGISLEKLVAALHAKFDGLGSIDTVTVYPHGPERELVVHETSLDTSYHTFRSEGDIDANELRQSEANRLGFLRRKLLQDLAAGEKIWVWRELGMTDPARLQPLLDVLRSLGPNILLWVTEADDGHPPGTVESLDPDFIRGYVERLARYENANDIRPASWFEVCENAYKLCHPDQVWTEPTESTVAVPPCVLSAMDFLARNPATFRSTAPAHPDKRRNWRSRLRRFLGF